MKRNLMRQMTGAVIAVMVAGTLLVGCDAKQVGEVEMKFINVEKVALDSGLVKQEQAYLKAVNENLHKGLQLAEKNYATLPADKVAAARQADKKIIAQQWQGQQRAARQVVLAAVKQAADAYRTEKKIAAIMPMQTAVSVAPELDVTADLTTKLNATKLDFGKVPEITVKAADTAKPAVAAK